MSISYADAISTLKSMFPEWDDETLGTILASNSYHVERTIETILAMSGDPDVGQQTPQAEVAVPTQPSSSGPSRSGARQSAPVAAPAAVPVRDPRNRGITCSLPEDFLRPPGYSFRMLADEELAAMLQNEMFQREARAMFGDEFVRNATAGGAAGPGRPQGQQQGTTRSNVGRPAAQTAASNNSSADASADLGIAKTLSSMGTAARRNLSLLAARFSSGQTTQTRNGETGNAREFKPLVDNTGDGEDDDEDVEFVTFDSRENNRSRHVLQDTAGDADDSENPLFQHGAATRGQTHLH